MSDCHLCKYYAESVGSDYGLGRYSEHCYYYNEGFDECGSIVTSFYKKANCPNYKKSIIKIIDKETGMSPSFRATVLLPFTIMMFILFFRCCNLNK
jgi:hypothetical protein